MIPARRRRFLDVVDLIPEFVSLVRASSNSIDFKARFWAFIDQQRNAALAPLLDDMLRLWSGVPSAPAWADARAVAERLAAAPDRVQRARVTITRHAEITGHAPRGPLVLVAGLRRPEGYSRFDRGNNTLFIGLDHAQSLANEDHFEVILAHELTHAVRDPQPTVLADYGGWTDMTHDDFIARHPFREHLVSEGMATAVSERVWPGKQLHRYVFFDETDYTWCDNHRREIADRLLRAIAEREDYHTFYARGSITADSPDCADYWFGFHLGRYALKHAAAPELLRLASTEFLDRYLAPFIESFVGQKLTPPRVAHPVAEGVAIPDTTFPTSVQRFHADLRAVLEAEPAAVARDAARLDADIADARLEYAGTPYGVCASPIVLAEEDLFHLRWASERVLGTIEKIVSLYREDASLRRYFGFPAHLEALASIDPGYRPLVPIGRFDSFWNGRDIRFLELNTNGTAAITLADRIGPLYAALPTVAPLVERHHAQTLPLVEPLIATLLDCWQQTSGADLSHELPCVAIVDWRALPTARELEQIREQLEARGIQALVADPSELSYDGRRLRARGTPVDVVYRRLTLVDLLQRAGELQALFSACSDGVAIAIGPFAADIAHSKRTFAALTHERWRAHFSPEERALIDAHVPWTRMFRPGRTLWGGRQCDLRELALAHKDRFVLKPAEGQEGRDVVLGIELTGVQWEREVARRWGTDQLIQELIEAPIRELQMPCDGGFVTTPMHLHVGQYVFGGALAGFLARASTQLVLSARSDDRVLPVLVLGDELATERASDLAHP